MRLIETVICITLALLYASPSLGQSSNVAVKKDDRFSAKFRSYSDLGDATKGMIDHIEMEAQWWTLLGDPVYQYGFKWVPSGQIKLESGDILERAKLSKYPDLVTRFDGIKPYSIEVTFDVAFHPRGVGLLLDKPKPLKTPNYYSGSNSVGGPATVARGTITTSRFLVADANKMMRDFSPSSPKEWKDFIEWEIGEPDNKSAKNTWQEATSVTFSDLRITKLKIPFGTPEQIFREFERREKGEDQEVSSDENTEKSRKKNEDETNIKNDPWASAGISASDENKETDDLGNRNDPWASATNSTENVKDPWANSISSSDFKIETRGSDMGVVGISGNVLIPFRDWEVLEYASGVAKIKEKRQTGKVPTKKSTCNGPPGTRCVSFGALPSYCYYDFTEAFVDESGKVLEVLKSYSSTAYCE